MTNINVFRAAYTFGNGGRIIAPFVGQNGIPSLVDVEQFFYTLGWSQQFLNSQGNVVVDQEELIAQLLYLGQLFQSIYCAYANYEVPAAEFGMQYSVMEFSISG